MIKFHVVSSVLWFLSLILGWVPFLGKWLKSVSMQFQFQSLFGLPYWKHNAKDIAQSRVRDLRTQWESTGYDPSANKAYARYQEVASFFGY